MTHKYNYRIIYKKTLFQTLYQHSSTRYNQPEKVRETIQTIYYELSVDLLIFYKLLQRTSG